MDNRSRVINNERGDDTRENVLQRPCVRRVGEDDVKRERARDRADSRQTGRSGEAEETLAREMTERGTKVHERKR